MIKVILTRRKNPSQPFDEVGMNNRMVITTNKFPANRQRLLHCNKLRTLENWLSGYYDTRFEVYPDGNLDGKPAQVITTRVDNLID